MKEKILHTLKENIGSYISGEALSESLGVSRTAVWKYIHELKKEGYIIGSSSKKGYSLEFTPDILNRYELDCTTDNLLLGRNIIFFDEIDSTNNHAKRLASEGCSEGTVVIAEKQTAGRGRLGRAWDSVSGKGIWMSVVLKPQIAPEDVQVITLAASVAITRAIRYVTSIGAGIKWPNDIILEGKKVCGILTEMNCETERVNFLVLGIGINVNHELEDFPEELRSLATSLKIYSRENGIETGSQTPERGFYRSPLVKRILIELENVYNLVRNSQNHKILEQWKDYSVTLGHEVRITSKNIQYTGKAVDITSDGKLVVKCSDGIAREISSGEISVRGVLGYT